MSDETSLDLTFASEYTILPMTRDCHKRFLSLDKLREDTQAAFASATVAHLPAQMGPNAVFQPSFVGQPLPNFFASQPVEPGPCQIPESCLWLSTVAAPETYPLMGDFLPLPAMGTDASYASMGPTMFSDPAYPYFFSATGEPSPPLLSHTHTSLPNTPLRTPRSSSVTPPHANANPANAAAASLFPDHGLQQQIALPQLHHAAPQSRKTKPKKKTQQVNPPRQSLMDRVLSTRDDQFPAPAGVRISRPQSRARPAPAQASQPVAGPSRLSAQAPVPQPPAHAFAMPSPYGPAFPYPHAQAQMLAHTQAAPVPASSTRTRPGSGAGPTRPAKTKERSAPYSKREPAVQKQQQKHSQQQQLQQQLQQQSQSAPPPSSLPLPAPALPLPLPLPLPIDELPTSHLTSSQADLDDTLGIPQTDYFDYNAFFDQWIVSEPPADAPPPPTDETS